MEVLFHFAFTLVKIAIQASIYSALLLLVFRLVAKQCPGGWFDHASYSSGEFWFRSGVVVSVALFAFLFTYWGFHGFGDGPRVPIGHGLFVDNTNWTEYGYINEVKTHDGKKLEMTRFLVFDERLLGNLDSWFETYSNQFFVYDMRDRHLAEFSTQTKFNAYAAMNGLPAASELRSFQENYSDRWGGWWFWLLP